MGSMKGFIDHMSAGEKDIGSMPFPSFQSLSDFLRKRGVRFRTSSLMNLGDKSILLCDGYGFRYEVEEDLVDWDRIGYNGSVYLSINSYCRLTGRSRSTVYKAHRDGRIRSLTVGKYNLVYIYWGAAE